MGSIGFVESFTQYFVLLAALGIPVYGVREIAKVKHHAENRSQVFSELLAVHAIATVVLSAVFTAIFLSIPSFAAYRHLFLIGLGILMAQVFLLEWLFQGLEQFKFITFRTLVVRLLAIGAIFILVRNETDVQLYYGISLLTIIGNLVMNLYYARRFVHVKLTGLQLKRHLKPIVYIYAFGVVVSVYTILDTAILGIFKGPIEVGYYTTAVKLSKLVITVLTALTLVTIPVLTQAYHAADFQRINGVLSKSFGYIALIGIPAWMGISIFANEFIMIFAGEQYLPAALPLQIMAPTILVIGLSNIFGMQIINPSNHEQYFLKAALLGMLVSVGLNLIIVPYLGHIGAAITTLITELVVMVGLYRFSVTIIDFNPPWKQLLQAMGASSVFFPIRFALSAIELHSLVSLFIGILLCATGYLVIQFKLFRNPMIAELIVHVSNKLRRR